MIPKEFPNVRCFNVDLPDDRTVDDQSNELLSALLAEFSAPAPSAVVAYRGRYRWERRYQAVALPAIPADDTTPPPGHLGLRHRGVYVITGGTGGIGLAIAKYLAATCQPTLVLTKKTPLPARSMWRTIVAAPDAPARLRTTLSELLELEATASAVEVVVADASDRQQMEAVPGSGDGPPRQRSMA